MREAVVVAPGAAVDSIKCVRLIDAERWLVWKTME